MHCYMCRVGQNIRTATCVGLARTVYTPTATCVGLARTYALLMCRVGQNTCTATCVGLARTYALLHV